MSTQIDRSEPIKVTIEFYPKTDPQRFDIETGHYTDIEKRVAGYTVTLLTQSGGQRVNGLAWDEMLGQVLSIFPAPRVPLYPHRPRLTDGAPA